MCISPLATLDGRTVVIHCYNQVTMPKKPPKKKPGRKPEVLKIEGNWIDAVDRALKVKPAKKGKK